MRVLVTRPAEDAQETVQLLAARGHEAVSAPLLVTHFLDVPAPSLAGVQAVLATSVNGIRALARLASRRDLAVFAVGPQTAQAAQRFGFAPVRNAAGDARALAESVMRWARPDGGALLHASGGASAALAVALRAGGFTVHEAVLYRVEAARSLPDHAAAALKSGGLDAALFFSPRSAGAFRDCVLDAGLGGLLAPLAAVCISAHTAGALGDLAFGAVLVSPAPNRAALLETLESLGRPDSD